jgi:hypothetical protein
MQFPIPVLQLRVRPEEIDFVVVVREIELRREFSAGFLPVEVHVVRRVVDRRVIVSIERDPIDSIVREESPRDSR